MNNSFNHISDMENIFDEVLDAQYLIENALKEYRNLQNKVRMIEDYYSSKQWIKDFEMDERGEIPPEVKRGVLSEDGIYRMLERNKEIMKMIGDD
ncbi:hypothetical protein bpr_III058 [Butyrivibrio proteoclasticus B316]|uniref:DUF4298 domain-containing protein n=1 Tax=Butyrivibrio proteoclasticus (strain ATCC 51982 / DSM 14932 / B316) TaxID=515622 RepID=E0S2W5_BUTPB|nr:DUF4298 domain-containing protein [Butyrivibrio proteoclasticus]ADL35747.1 hypothetical protein bpr_III058 [Butyrivibrio proteoclasticus B316]